MRQGGDQPHRPEVVGDGEGQQEQSQRRRHARRGQGESGEGEGDVGGAADWPAMRRAAAAGVEGQIDEGRGDHAAGRRQDRGRQPPDAGELAAQHLELDLQPDDQEEQGHQPVLDPCLDRSGLGELADPQRDRLGQEAEVVAGQRRVGDDKGCGRRRHRRQPGHASVSVFRKSRVNRPAMPRGNTPAAAPRSQTGLAARPRPRPCSIHAALARLSARSALPGPWAPSSPTPSIWPSFPSRSCASAASAPPPRSASRTLSDDEWHSPVRPLRAAAGQPGPAAGHALPRPSVPGLQPRPRRWPRLPVRPAARGRTAARTPARPGDQGLGPDAVVARRRRATDAQGRRARGVGHRHAGSAGRAHVRSLLLVSRRARAWCGATKPSRDPASARC